MRLKHEVVDGSRFGCCDGVVATQKFVFYIRLGEFAAYSVEQPTAHGRAATVNNQHTVHANGNGLCANILLHVTAKLIARRCAIRKIIHKLFI